MEEEKGFSILALIDEKESINSFVSKTEFPWNFNSETKSKFLNLIKNNIVIVGRKTFCLWKEIFEPANTFILSRTLKEKENYFMDLNFALSAAYSKNKKIYVIGGSQIFNVAVNHPDLIQILLYNINNFKQKNILFFPNFSHRFIQKNQENQEIQQLKEVKNQKLELEYTDFDQPIFTLIKSKLQISKINNINNTQVDLSKIDLKHVNPDKKSNEKKNEKTNKNSEKEELEERAYLNLMIKVWEQGEVHDDRTGVGTHRLLGQRLEYDLRDGRLPIFTTKFVSPKTVWEELQWFLSGSTDNNILLEKKVRIWEANSSKEFMAKQAKNSSLTEEQRKMWSQRKAGDVGPMYSFTWRHFGAKYIDCKTDYFNQGFDQIQNIIKKLKTSPKSRQIILTAWDPTQIDNMVLPPCHDRSHWIVENENELTCILSQRSADLYLGVGFNVTSYAFLTMLFAHCTNLKPGKLIHLMDDCHVYKNHVDQINLQSLRTGFPFPKIKFKCLPKVDPKFYSYDDIEWVTKYNHHSFIPAPMAL